MRNNTNNPNLKKKTNVNVNDLAKTSGLSPPGAAKRSRRCSGFLSLAKGSLRLSTIVFAILGHPAGTLATLVLLESICMYEDSIRAWTMLR